MYPSPRASHEEVLADSGLFYATLREVLDHCHGGEPGEGASVIEHKKLPRVSHVLSWY